MIDVTTAEFWDKLAQVMIVLNVYKSGVELQEYFYISKNL
jgi:hypothetical protein